MEIQYKSFKNSLLKLNYFRKIIKKKKKKIHSILCKWKKKKKMEKLPKFRLY